MAIPGCRCDYCFKLRGQPDEYTWSLWDELSAPVISWDDMEENNVQDEHVELGWVFADEDLEWEEDGDDGWNLVFDDGER
jgi:hypothetical protein